MNRKTLNWIALLGTLMFALLACDVMSVKIGRASCRERV